MWGTNPIKKKRPGLFHGKSNQNVFKEMHRLGVAEQVRIRIIFSFLFDSRESNWRKEGEEKGTDEKNFLQLG